MRNSLDFFWGTQAPTQNARSTFEQIFEAAFQQPFSSASEAHSAAERWLKPAVDVEETENAYVLTADLPGIRKEDLQIDVKENVLTISGERKNEKRHGKFSRQFTLPRSVDAERIEANLDDGVLTIALLKSEKAKPRSIQIQSGSPSLLAKFLGTKTKSEKDATLS